MRKKQRKVIRKCSAGKAIVMKIDSGIDELEHQMKPQKKIKTCLKSSAMLLSNEYQKIPFLPQIQLTLADMKNDPIQLLMKLQAKFKEFGAVKLKACPQWNSPFSFKYTEKGITTRVQKIHRLTLGKAFKEKTQQYNIKSFTNYALDFEKSYKFKFQKSGKTIQSELQYEYWNIVNIGNINHTKDGEADDKAAAFIEEKYRTKVQYAADLPVHQYGSGFPRFGSKKSKDLLFSYDDNLFNLNNLYKSPSSILQIAQKNNENISGMTIPWVYMGMLFSSFCWHVEDLWLNSINYNHQGNIKVWYILPESQKQKFDAYVLKKTNQRDLLDSITFMIDPLELMKNGIKVYKTYQRPKQYICTFFKAYHCGFSEGFNVGQAVNFASIDSLDTIKSAITYYKHHNSQKPSVISYDWIIYNNILNNYKHPIKIIEDQYKTILQKMSEYLLKASTRISIQKYTIIPENVKYDKYSCKICKNYVYIAHLECKACQKIFCFNHSIQNLYCCNKQYTILMRKIIIGQNKCKDIIASFNGFIKKLE